MVLVEDLFHVTKALYDHVTQQMPKDMDARAQYVETLEEYLSKRASLLSQMETTTNYSDSEKSMGEEILKMNEEIQRYMEISRGELRLGMQELKKKKQSS
ncbi:hypothetical protein D7Z54_00500 [Salibacterium salarium]|uniref:Flagellar protein FliT n=1 Tax=Salibacterium salarium TaxID=284579 RepID=A0A428N9R9_9BACI|nr:hypothetical protein [Salibacterium salarium]RSL35090.1 hypothetical protein D7Z54_00500 [Salibacterium salarium]